MLEKKSQTQMSSHFSPPCSFIIVIIFPLAWQGDGTEISFKQGAQVYYFHLSGCVFPSHLSVLIGM